MRTITWEEVGTRGYGKVAFQDLEFSLKTKDDYKGDNLGSTIFEGPFATLQDADLKMMNSAQK